jgi:hypothetical protein
MPPSSSYFRPVATMLIAVSAGSRDVVPVSPESVTRDGRRVKNDLQFT